MENRENTIGDFFETLGKRLRVEENADIELVDILRAHVLKASPNSNAVAQAKNAIMKLAEDRANLQQTGSR